MAKRKGMPLRVYWQTGAWRYKVRDAREKAILGSTWVRLGKTESDVYKNYWPMVGSKVGAKAGMQDLWDKYSLEVLPTKSFRTRSDDEKMWSLMKPMFKHSHPADITRRWGIPFLDIGKYFTGT